MADPSTPDSAIPDSAETAEPLVFVSRPANAGEAKLVEKYYESYAAQNKLMDDLGRQMLTVELAVPGLYASILALLRGEEATLPGGPWLAVTFGGWALAALLTFIALFPRDYKVDTAMLRADPEATDGVLGIEDYFRRPAQYKWRLLAAAGVAFWLGVLGAVWLLAG